MEKPNHRHLPKATQAVKDSAGIYPGRLTPRTRAVNSRSPGTLEGRTDSELEEAVISWCSQVEDVEEVRLWGRVTFLNWVSEKRQIRRRVKSVGWKKFYLNRPLHYSAFIPSSAVLLHSTLSAVVIHVFPFFLAEGPQAGTRLCATACPGLGTQPSVKWSGRGADSCVLAVCSRVSPLCMQSPGLCVPNLFL